MNLAITGKTLNGSASGQFQDNSRHLALIVGGTPSTAVAVGTVGAQAASGGLDGQVGIGAYSCSNNGHSWTLVPR